MKEEESRVVRLQAVEAKGRKANERKWKGDSRKEVVTKNEGRRSGERKERSKE